MDHNLYYCNLSHIYPFTASLIPYCSQQELFSNFSFVTACRAPFTIALSKYQIERPRMIFFELFISFIEIQQLVGRDRVQFWQRPESTPVRLIGKVISKTYA